MARVKIELNRRGMAELLNSSEVQGLLEDLAAPVDAAARRDSNAAYAASIETNVHRSSGRSGRVSVRVGAMPGLGMAVEAKRGTLARALGEA